MNEFNDWEQIAEKFGQATDQVVRKSAFDIQAGYQARVKVDTGFAKNSAYVVTDEESTYGQGTGSPPKGAELLPEERPEGKHEAIVGVGASYGISLEFGTVHMPAYPALIPAVDAVRPSFEAAMSKIEEKLKEIRG